MASRKARMCSGLLPQQAPMMLVPASSIVQRDGRNLVFAIDDGRARARAVTPGQTYSDLRLVEGIAVGTQVVKQPPAELGDGAKVAVGTGK